MFDTAVASNFNKQRANRKQLALSRIILSGIAFSSHFLGNIIAEKISLERFCQPRLSIPSEGISGCLPPLGRLGGEGEGGNFCISLHNLAIYLSLLTASLGQPRWWCVSSQQDFPRPFFDRRRDKNIII